MGSSFSVSSLSSSQRKNKGAGKMVPSSSKAVLSKKELKRRKLIAKASSSVEEKLSKKLKSVKKKKLELTNGKVDPAKIARDIRKGKIKLRKSALMNPKSEEDFRLIHLRKIAKLHRIARQLENEILGPEANNRVVYVLSQVYERMDASCKALQNMRTAEDRKEVLNRKLLVPLMTKLVSSMDVISKEIKKSILEFITDDKAKTKVVEGIDEILIKRSRDFQEHYEQGLKTLDHICEADL